MANISRGVLLDKILKHFLAQCYRRNLEVDPDFARHYIHLLACDMRIGLNTKTAPFHSCKAQDFLKAAMRMYASRTDATLCNLKLTYYHRDCKDKKLDYVTAKYEKMFNDHLRILTDDILRYPENSNQEQIEQMLHKMQVFIIVCYSIGSPKNHVLLNMTRQSLKSVIGTVDLQNYVRKKRYHRLEYLQRLAATVCGILIYNNQAPDGEKENMRDILADLEMAQRNTKENFEQRIKQLEDLKTKGSTAMESIIQINIHQQTITCRLPIERVCRVNRYVILFTILQRFLNDMFAIFENTVFLISNGVKKLQCVVEKINDVLKYRSAIESELVFPHFVYLSEVWQSLVSCLNHMAELNKIKEQMDEIISPDVELKFHDVVSDFEERTANAINSNELTFKEVFEGHKWPESDINFTKSDNLRDYCSLTLALTNGLLVPAQLHKKLCANYKFFFGFHNMEFAKYAERYREDYFDALQNVIFNTVDLITLFNLETEVITKYEQMTKEPELPYRHLETQTEMVIENDLSVPNQINVTWNVWDFHREAIHLANIRKRQTHSTQTVLSYGQRAAQNQTYNARRHK